MSSLTNRSATGAIKTKVQNVNSVYSGKNQLQGGKPVGRNGGLTAIGKASGVVRRMPPPPTLPSLRAESQGQDPDIAIVPQGGTGWSKSDTSTAVSTSSPAASTAVASESKSSLTSAVSAASATSGVDMRPAWAKPPSTAAPPTETAPVAGFPTLASAAAAASEETKASRTWRSSGSMSEEPMHELPARFYDGGNGPARPYQPSRFQGSSDARATQPGATYGSGAPVASSGRPTGAERWSVSESREAIPEEPIKKDRASPVIEPAPRSENSHDYTKRNGAAADEQQPVQHQPQHPLKLLKRPANAAAQQQQQSRAAAATLADLNRSLDDEDEELRMTKLSKPATRVMKRCGPGQQSDGGTAAEEEMQQQPREERRQQQQKQKTAAAAAPTSSQERYSEEDRSEHTASTPPSQLSQAENIWEKRKEERASAERERAHQRQARNIEAAIQQHFPSVAEAATMRVDKESTRKPTDPDFARVTLRARRGPIVNDVRALQDDGSSAPAAAAPPPPRPRQQQQQMQPRPNNNRPEEEYGSGEYGGGGGGYDRRREYGSDNRRQYDGPQRGGYDRRDNYRSEYGRPEGRYDKEYARAEEGEKGYGREERSERPEGGEEEDNRGATNGVRREYQPRGGRGGGGGQRGQRGNGYPSTRGGRGGQRNYRREDQEEGEMQQEEGVQPVQQHPSDKRSWRRASPVEGDQPEGRGEGQKEGEDADGAPRRRYNNPQHMQQTQPRVLMTRGVRGGRGNNARGSARGGAATNTRRSAGRDEQPADIDAQDKQHAAHAAPRPTRGLYAPRGARRGEGRNTRGEATGDDGAAAAAADEGSNSNLLQSGSNQRDTTIRLKSPVCVSSEGHEEWETASESSQTGERKSRDQPAALAAASRSNGTTSAHSQHLQQQPKNGLQPASRTYNTTHAKREGGMKRGERPERQAPRKESAGKRVQREDSEESVDRLAGLDLHDERRVVIVDNHPATTHLSPTDHADFEEVLSKKQKRARAEEEKAKAEAEERKRQREKERAERVMAKKEKRVQAKSEREEAQRAQKAEAVARKKAEKEDKAMKTVWNSAQPEARAALESAEAAAAAAATTTVTVDAAGAAAAADGLVLPSPIARPRAGTAAAAKKPAVELPPSESRGVQDKYEFMFDEEAARTAADVAAAQKDTTEDSDERITLAPSETGSAITTDDQRRLTENVNLCKELWSSGDVTMTTAAAAGTIPAVAPLMVQHHISSVSSAHHSPAAAAAGAAGLPTNVAKVKPQPHSVVSASASDAGDASGASCLPRPPSANTIKQTIMAGLGGGMHSNGMQMGHPQSMMGARSPASMASSFNPGFGGYNNVFGGTSNEMGGLTNGGGGGGGFPLKAGMQAVSPPNMHGSLYGSRLQGMQQQQRGFDQGGGLFPHPANRSSNSMAPGWSAPFEPMMAPPSSTTPPNVMGNHSHQHGSQQMSRTNNMFGLFGGAPSQPPRPQHGGFSAPPPQMAPQHGGHHANAPTKTTMMPPLFSNELMNMPPPALSSLLGAVGDRAARQLQQSQQQQQMQHGFGGGDSRGGHHHPQQPGGFSMPPPVMGGGGGGLYTRPPPSSTDMWKGGAQTTAQQHMQQQSGRSYGGGGGGQYGGGNNNGRMMHNQSHHNQGMHGGAPHHPLGPPPPQHMQHSQQQQQFGGAPASVGGDMWMQQGGGGGGGGGGHFGGAPMGRAMNMGGRSDNSSTWRN